MIDRNKQTENSITQLLKAASVQAAEKCGERISGSGATGPLIDTLATQASVQYEIAVNTAFKRTTGEPLSESQLQEISLRFDKALQDYFKPKS